MVGCSRASSGASAKGSMSARRSICGRSPRRSTRTSSQRSATVSARRRRPGSARSAAKPPSAPNSSSARRSRASAQAAAGARRGHAAVPGADLQPLDARAPAAAACGVGQPGALGQQLRLRARLRLDAQHALGQRRRRQRQRGRDLDAVVGQRAARSARRWSACWRPHCRPARSSLQGQRLRCLSRSMRQRGVAARQRQRAGLQLLHAGAALGAQRGPAAVGGQRGGDAAALRRPVGQRGPQSHQRRQRGHGPGLEFGAPAVAPAAAGGVAAAVDGELVAAEQQLGAQRRGGGRGGAAYSPGSASPPAARRRAPSPARAGCRCRPGAAPDAGQRQRWRRRRAGAASGPSAADRRCGPCRQADPASPGHQGTGSKSTRLPVVCSCQSPRPARCSVACISALAAPACARALSQFDALGVGAAFDMARRTGLRRTVEQALEVELPVDLQGGGRHAAGGGALQSGDGRPRTVADTGPVSVIAAARPSSRCGVTASSRVSSVSCVALPLRAAAPAAGGARGVGQFDVEARDLQPVGLGQRPAASSVTRRTGSRPSFQRPGRVFSMLDAWPAAAAFLALLTSSALPVSRVCGASVDSAARSSAVVCRLRPASGQACSNCSLARSVQRRRGVRGRAARRAAWPRHRTAPPCPWPASTAAQARCVAAESGRHRGVQGQRQRRQVADARAGADRRALPVHAGPCHAVLGAGLRVQHQLLQAQVVQRRQCVDDQFVHPCRCHRHLHRPGDAQRHRQRPIARRAADHGGAARAELQHVDTQPGLRVRPPVPASARRRAGLPASAMPGRRPR